MKFLVKSGLTGLFCPCLLFGRNIASMNDEIVSEQACVGHAVCVEGGITLALVTASCNGIDPDTVCLITEGLLFAWWVCGIYTGMGRQLLQRKYHLRVTTITICININIWNYKLHELMILICRIRHVIHAWCTVASTGVPYARNIER